MTFIKGDDYWRLTWIECRLHCIESAENMSYHIQGFRETHGSFPKEIYYSADPLKVKSFYEKRKPVTFQDIISKPEPKDDNTHDGTNDDNNGVDSNQDSSNNNNNTSNSQYYRSSNDSNGSTIQQNNVNNHHGNHYYPPMNDSASNEKHVRSRISYRTSRGESFQSDTLTDLSAIAATLADMQKSIHDLREPWKHRDPKAVAAYERAQMRDLVDQWISGRREDPVGEPSHSPPQPRQPLHQQPLQQQLLQQQQQQRGQR